LKVLKCGAGEGWRSSGLTVRKIKLKVLKCGAGEGWRSVGPTVRKIKKYYVESRRKGVSSLHQEEVRLIGFVISSVGTAF
jgi:hypothetical protein